MRFPSTKRRARRLARKRRRNRRLEKTGIIMGSKYYSLRMLRCSKLASEVAAKFAAIKKAQADLLAELMAVDDHVRGKA